MCESIIETVSNTRGGIQWPIKDIKARGREICSKMNSYPVAERQFIKSKHRQKIIRGVYLILLQRQEETALILGQTEGKAQVVNPACVESKSVDPRKLFVLIRMSVLALAIPISYLFVGRQSSPPIQEYKKQSGNSE